MPQIIGGGQTAGLIKFGMSSNERYFDTNGRYYNERRRLENACAALINTNPQNGGQLHNNPANIPQFYPAVTACVMYHFRMIASITCQINGVCMDNVWRCAIDRINQNQNSPVTINHAPLQNPVTNWLGSGASEFYSVIDRNTGRTASIDIALNILHEAFVNDP